jgi:acetyltransferase-like isoleucine patch superfamily enzyme
MRKFSTHGTGRFKPEQLRRCGDNVIFEEGVLVFHPENVVIGSNVYVGHGTILKGYHGNLMEIGSDTWIGQGCFFHSAGGLRIGSQVGFGPFVRILTSTHRDHGRSGPPILASEIEFAPVVIEDECHIGLGAILLPGVTIGRGTQIGAGSVVTSDLPEFCVAAGSPAKILRRR